MGLKKTFKYLMRRLVGALGFALIKKSSFQKMVRREKEALEFRFLKRYSGLCIKSFLQYKPLSKSQINQDLFVLIETCFKRKGYFVEFGATDGVSLNNTYLLEKEFNWNGLLAEPARCWYPNLENNRSAKIIRKCVWRISGEILPFTETSQKSLSSISRYGKTDIFRLIRKNNNLYKVESISLFDLLQENGAPTTIDYLSIDTEGSEFEILKPFPFDKYFFRVITVEHNFSSDRDKIYKLLTENNYSRIHSDISEFDDWYVYKGDLH